MIGSYLIFQYWTTVQRYAGELCCCSYKRFGQSDSEDYLHELLEMGFILTREEVKEEYEKLRLREGLLSVH